jgi:hypothetical protein
MNIFCEEPFIVIHTEHDDLEYPSFTDSIIFFILDEYEITIFKVTFPTLNFISFGIGVTYVGDNWRFLSGDIVIKTDENLYKHYDGDPHRSVLSEGRVLERIQSEIRLETINDMANTEILRIQFYGNPIDIPKENILYIKQFYDECCNYN